MKFHNFSLFADTHRSGKCRVVEVRGLQILLCSVSPTTPQYQIRCYILTYKFPSTLHK